MLRCEPSSRFFRELCSNFGGYLAKYSRVLQLILAIERDCSVVPMARLRSVQLPKILKHLQQKYFVLFVRELSEILKLSENPLDTRPVGRNFILGGGLK